MKTRKLALFISLAVAIGMTAPSDAQTDNLPQTVAESSDWTATSSSAEVLEFVDACVAAADHVSRFDYGTTVEGRPMVGVAITDGRPYELGEMPADRLVALVIGNIHSGECAGKEALLMMLRELTRNPDHPWLKEMVILIVPNYSADSNDRVGKFNRPGQAGPEAGMGRRENAQGLDLNRDFMKIESPEAQAMVGLIDLVNPHLFVDCHTTNGSIHRYALTYDIPHNPASPAPIRQFLRQKMMPAVTAQLEGEKGLNSFYYGNFNRDKTSWTTYGYEPRYSTEYVGLRGRLAVLSEAYAYISYRERIEVSREFVASLLDYIAENAATVRTLLDEVEREWVATATERPERISLPLAARMKAFPGKFLIKGYVDDRAEPREDRDYEVEFVGDYEATRTTPLPFGWLLAADQVRAVDRLLGHGIEVERLTGEVELDVELDRVVGLDRAQRAFQRHQMVRLETDRELGRQIVPAGAFLVRSNQPLGRLAGYLLESESDDGLAFWNYFDAWLDVGQLYPVWRIPQPVELTTEDVESVEPAIPLSLDLIDGPNRLFADAPDRPEWKGKTNWIAAESWGRRIWVDAESMSFLEPSQPPVPRQELRDQLADLQLPDEVVSALSRAEPSVSDDLRTAVYEAEGYAVVAHEGRLSIVGIPEAAAELIHFNHDESILICHVAGKLRFVDLASGERIEIVPDRDDERIGKLDWVYQEELYGRGNFKGFWASPTSDQVAFLALDETPVLRYTVTDHRPVRGRLEVTPYPKAGDPLPGVRVGLANCRNGEVQWVDFGWEEESEPLVSRVTWTPDGRQLLVQIQNREQTWLDLWSVDPKSGSARKMFRDQTPAWIESPGDPVFLADGSFVWLSPRDGYRHLYRYGADGEPLTRLTEGEWEVRELWGASPEGDFVYFSASREGPHQLHPYRLELATGETTQLVDQPGTHEISFSHDFGFFIDSFSSVDQPPQYRLYRSDGEWLRDLNVAIDDRWDYVIRSEPEFIEVVQEDGPPLDAMLIKPPDFDPSRKYPVLVHIYAGPQAPRVRDRFGGQWYLWHQYLAQQGYLVWMCDNRSASFRSSQGAWPIHRNLAEAELADIERGLDWLHGQSWVDSERIGIWGWSYGGYMTAYALTHSDSFRLGISGAPVTDWRNYDAIYTERYMGTPQNNPEGYAASSVLESAANLSGHLLLIHGTLDDNVHLGNSLQFVESLQKAGKQFQFMAYPGSRHGIREEFRLRHLRKLMTDTILLHL